MSIDVIATAEPVAEMNRMGDEIAELSAHLEAAGARLLDLIREFDARGGWNTGFASCAHWFVISQNLSPGVSQNLSPTRRAGRCSLLTAS